MERPEKSANLVSVGSQIYYNELKNGRIHYNKDWFQQAISRTSNITVVNMISNTNAKFRHVLLCRNYNGCTYDVAISSFDTLSGSILNHKFQEGSTS